MPEIGESGGTKVGGEDEASKRPMNKGAKTRPARKAGNKSAPPDVVAMKSVAQYPRFVSLEEREKMVERSKRAVYAHLNKITNAHINLAAKGNCQSAKFLFEFAGIEKIPALAFLEKTKAKLSYPYKEAADEDPMKAVRAFSEKVGIPFPKLKPPRPVEVVEEPSDQVQSAV